MTMKDLPKEGFAREKIVLRTVPFSKSTLWRKVKDGTYPKPHKLDEGITAWRVEDVRAYINKFPPRTAPSDRNT